MFCLITKPIPLPLLSMASQNPHYFPWLLLFLLLGVSNSFAKSEEYKTYIIHMDRSQKPETFSTDESWHRSTLTSLSSFQEDQLLYSYDRVIHGFSIRLTPSQLSEIEKHPAHRATQQESFGKLFTTHTTKFLGLKHKSGIWPAASYGKDVIIGIIDTGIWPESESFQDKGMSPVRRDGRENVRMAQLLALRPVTGSSLEPSPLAKDSLLLVKKFTRVILNQLETFTVMEPTYHPRQQVTQYLVLVTLAMLEAQPEGWH